MSNYKDLSGKASAGGQKNTTLFASDSSNVSRIKGFIFCLLPLLILFVGIYMSINLSANWFFDTYLSGLMPVVVRDGTMMDESVSLFDKISEESQENKEINTFPAVMWNAEFARLSIEDIDLSDIPVYNGDAETQLRKGVGHFTGSRFPGQGGNVVLLAHRNREFYAFKDIEIGDIVTLETFYATYVYRVVETAVLDPDDYSLIYPDDSSERLTMYTCYPFDYVGHAPNRFYVVCEMISGDIWDRDSGTFIPYTEEGSVAE